MNNFDRSKMPEKPAEDFVHKSAMVFNTPDGIELYRLASIKARLKLESRGLKTNRGPATRTKVAKELGLKPRDSFDKFLEAIQEKIDAQKLTILMNRLIIEDMGAEEARYISCDRSAYLSVDTPDSSRGGTVYRVGYYAAEDLLNAAKPPTEYPTREEADKAALAWVLEVR